MSWFDIVKDAKEDGEKFYEAFKKAIIEQVTGALEELDKDEKRLQEAERTHEAMISSLSPMERVMIKPLIDRQIESREEARAEMNSARKMLNSQLKEIKDMFLESDQFPIETRLVVLRDQFGEFPGFDGNPIINIKTLDDVIHNLGFQGKGFE